MPRNPSTIRIEGHRELRRAFAGMEAATENLKEAHTAAAGIVEAEASASASFREPTGSLMSSLRSSGTKTKGVVRLGTRRFPYAGVIHFGTPASSGRPANIEPNPFLYDALDKRRDEVVEKYNDRIKEIVRTAVALT